MANDGGSNPPIPSRQERKACHAGRDKYFECLDANGIEDPAAAGTLCGDLKKAMYGACPTTWASYFEQLRALQKKQARLYQDPK